MLASLQRSSRGPDLRGVHLHRSADSAHDLVGGWDLSRSILRTLLPALRSAPGPRPRDVAVLPVLPRSAALASSAAASRPVAARATPGVPTRHHITGHGYGHGHGLSQYGARGAARQGLTLPADRRVLLPRHHVGPGRRQDPRADHRRHRPRRPGRGPRAASRSASLAAHAHLAAPVGGRQEVATDRRRATTPWSPTRGDRWHDLEEASRRGGVLLATGRPSRWSLPAARRDYRGTLQLGRPAPGQAPPTVNRLSMEAYLRGVVPQEVPALWAPAAVSAQSVAARTYAAFERAHPSAGSLRPLRHHPVPGLRRARRRAPGCRRGDQGHGRQVSSTPARPAFTQFSASNGGLTSAGLDALPRRPGGPLRRLGRQPVTTGPTTDRQGGRGALARDRRPHPHRGAPATATATGADG